MQTARPRNFGDFHVSFFREFSALISTVWFYRVIFIKFLEKIDYRGRIFRSARDGVTNQNKKPPDNKNAEAMSHQNLRANH